MSNNDIFFKKTGKEIKKSLQNKKNELEIRLNIRKDKFDKFIHNPPKVASFLMQDSKMEPEEREELWQISNRINEIETELNKMKIQIENLADDEIYKLNYNELVESGFNLYISE